MGRDDILIKFLAKEKLVSQAVSQAVSRSR